MTNYPEHDRNAAFVNEIDPPVRPAPLLSVGPVAWVRNNLFSSLFDTILTILSIVSIIMVTVGVLTWSFTGANWFVITFNMRQFMIGRLETSAEWRINLIGLIVLFAVGLAMAAFARFRWRLFVGLAVTALLVFVIPIAINSAIALPDAYTAAANMPIQSGSVTREAQPSVAFIAQEGETLTFRIADLYSADDESLAMLHSFADMEVNAVLQAARRRLADIERLAELEALLAGDPITGDVLLTANQVDVYTDEYEGLEIPRPVTETYSINHQPVMVQIMRGTGDIIAEARLDSVDDVLEVVLPEDGWYVLAKSIEGDAESVALLAMSGVYPILERNFTLSEIIDDEGNVVPARRVNQFMRMTDSFLVEDARPEIDGQEPPALNIIDNQYRGLRPFSDYLRVYLSPYFEQIAPGVISAVIAMILGFALGKVLTRMSPAEHPGQYALRTTTWVMAALPVITFGLVYGIGGGPLPFTDTSVWGGLLLTMMLTMVGIIGAFPIGVALALGRRSDLPVIRYASTIYIEAVRGVPLITVLFMAQLLVPLMSPALKNVDNVFRAMVGITLFSAAYLAENVRGGLQSVPPGQVEAARALGLSAMRITMLITLPQALRAVIPALVGQFISLFKDTSLVAIVGLIDMTGISNAVVAQTEFLGLRREAFVFITIIYFVFSYVMSWVSRRVEETGSGSVRRG